MNQRVISFRGSGGRLVELMRMNDGTSMRRLPNRKFVVTHPKSDIVVSASLPRRQPLPGGGLAPRTSRAVYVDGMSADSRFPNRKPLGGGPGGPASLLHVARGGLRVADRANLTVRAHAGWFGTRPSKGGGEGLTAINYDRDNRRLRGAYEALGFRKDREAIKQELAGYEDVRSRRDAARMIRRNPELVRYPKSSR